MDQKPYTIEQFQRCLKAATKLSCAVYDMKTQPLNPDILKELYKAQEEYIKIQTDVVNESCGLQ
jgi:biotin synthase-related radical SAM superfamily protein